MVLRWLACILGGLLFTLICWYVVLKCVVYFNNCLLCRIIYYWLLDFAFVFWFCLTCGVMLFVWFFLIFIDCLICSEFTLCFRRELLHVLSVRVLWCFVYWTFRLRLCIFYLLHLCEPLRLVVKLMTAVVTVNFCWWC